MTVKGTIPGKIKISPLARDWLLCSTRWIRDLVSKGVIPEPKNGFFGLSATVNGYITFLRNQNKDEQLQKLKVRHLDGRVKKLKIETDALAGVLIPKTEHTRILQEAGAAFEKGLLREIPQRLASLLSGVRKADSIEDDVYEKFIAWAVRRYLLDTIRVTFYGGKTTPTVRDAEWELLSHGFIRADVNGQVIDGGGRLRAADTVVKEGRESVAKIGGI